MSLLPAYPSVVARVKDGAFILDVGCGLGQDIRELAAAGCPTNRIFACDVVHGFWDIGFDLFRDCDKFSATFMLADVVLHLYGWNQQAEILAALVPLTKAGSMIFGCGCGLTKGTEIETRWKNATKTMFYHDDQTMRELWKQVGEATGTEWEVKPKSFSMDSFPMEKEDYEWIGPDVRMSIFEAIRVARD